MNQPILYNLEFLKTFTKGDPGKIERYINTYLKTSSRIFKELEDATLAEDWETLYVKAHSLKPQVQYMGIIELQELLLEIENLTKSTPEPEQLKTLVANASKIFYISHKQLQSYTI